MGSLARVPDDAPDYDDRGVMVTPVLASKPVPELPATLGPARVPAVAPDAIARGRAQPTERLFKVWM